MESISYLCLSSTIQFGLVIMVPVPPTNSMNTDLHLRIRLSTEEAVDNLQKTIDQGPSEFVSMISFISFAPLQLITRAEGLSSFPTYIIPMKLAVTYSI